MDQLIAGIEDGAPALVGGLGDLQSGVEKLLAGLQSGDPNDPGFVEGLQQISGGLSQLLAGLGNSADPANTVTVIGGVKTMTDGLNQLLLGLGNSNDPANPLTVIGGVKTMSEGVTTLLANMQGGLQPLVASLQADLVSANTLYGASDPVLFATMVGKIAAIAAALGDGSLPPNEATVIGAVQLVSGGLTQLLGSLQTNDPNNPGFREGMQQLAGGLSGLLASLQTNDPNNPGFREGLLGIKAGADQLSAGLGDVNDPPSPTTIIGALLLIGGGLDEAGPGAGTLVDTVLGALGQMQAGLTNPQFTKKQDELDGKTPKEYFADCPACFDPDSDRFDPATSDPAFQPSFLEVFNLFSEGIDDALPLLDSLDEKAPGLVDGLEQVVGGLDDLAAALHTFDPDDPGLVDGIELVRGGLQQVSSGIFALNELGIRTMRGQIGDQGDAIGMDQATLVDAANVAGSDSALDADADVVSATYVFDLAAQSTASNDNLRRGALMGLALLGTALMTRRMRRFEL
jgi:putative membrane protein